MARDCGFTEGQNWFRYRAAAIIVEEGCVLLVGNELESYLYSVGGGVACGEHSEEAVRREVKEETGVDYEVERLAVVHENFFNGNGGTLDGLTCHEITLYYLMKPRGTRALHSNSYTHGVRERMHWIPIAELGTRRAFPSFLKDYLSAPHPGILHLVTDDRSPTAN